MPFAVDRAQAPKNGFASSTTTVEMAGDRSVRPHDKMHGTNLSSKSKMLLNNHSLIAPLDLGTVAVAAEPRISAVLTHIQRSIQVIELRFDNAKIVSFMSAITEAIFFGPAVSLAFVRSGFIHSINVGY